MSTDQQWGSTEWCKTAPGKIHLNGADPGYLQRHMKGHREPPLCPTVTEDELCVGQEGYTPGLCTSAELVQLTPNLKRFLHNCLPKQVKRFLQPEKGWRKEVSSAREAALSHICTSPGHFTCSFTSQLYQRYGAIFHSSHPALFVTLPSSYFPAAGVLVSCKQRMVPLQYSKIPKSCCTPLDL